MNDKMNVFIYLFELKFEVWSAHPTDAISAEKENDATKLYSASELERAKNAGLSDESLIIAKAYGYTLEEMIKLKQLENDPEVARSDITRGYMVWIKQPKI